MMASRPNPSGKSPWLKTFRPVLHPRLRFYCFPYAGGSARVFRRFSDALPLDIEVIGVELPGRGARTKEPAITRMDVLLDAMEPAIIPTLDRPFVLFGHSMGGRIAFELARRLRRLGKRAPVHLFISATPAPGAPARRPLIYDLSDAEFIEGIRRHGGTPEDILTNPQMLEVVLPPLRADFTLIEAFGESPEPPLDVPITAYGGQDDHEVPPEDLVPWRQQTTHHFDVVTFAGGHFFLHTSEDALFNSIRTKLAMPKRG